MYKIVTGKQMAEIDRVAIDTRNIPAEQLMESAGQGVVQFILSRVLARPGDPVVVLCGKGNNGGDGFVVARGLFDHGIQSRVFLFGSPDQLRGDAALNWNRLPDSIRDSAVQFDPERARESAPEAYSEALGEAVLIVDALFGTGFKGVLAPNWDVFLAPLRRCRDRVLAVDIASGVNANDGSVSPGSVPARWTVTMGLPKRGQLIGRGMDHTGLLKVVDIGFPDDLVRCRPEDPALLEPNDITPLLPRRELSAHKGTAGRLLVIAGSTGLTGAATLCAGAALLGGAGL